MKNEENIIITYCPSSIEKDRICGHTFEVMDYFLVLYDTGIKSTILIQEDIPEQKVFDAWEDKYNLPEDYRNFITFKRNNKIIIAKDILIFTGGLQDGYLKRTKLIYKKLILMRCNPFFNYHELIKKDNVFLLQDDRVYVQDSLNSKVDTQVINYTKKIYFNRYKKLDKTEDKILVYVNSNLRKLEDITFRDNYIYVSGDIIDTKNILIAPVPKLFEKFNTFLYTKTTRQFDCSPRLITECAYYGKAIHLDFDFSEYAKKDSGDTGLYWRWFDIQNNFMRLNLSSSDEILTLINTIKGN